MFREGVLSLYDGLAIVLVVGTGEVDLHVGDGFEDELGTAALGALDLVAGDDDGGGAGQAEIGLAGTAAPHDVGLHVEADRALVFLDGRQVGDVVSRQDACGQYVLHMRSIYYRVFRGKS
jgi:hypothetical protein